MEQSKEPRGSAEQAASAQGCLTASGAAAGALPRRMEALL